MKILWEDFHEKHISKCEAQGIIDHAFGLGCSQHKGAFHWQREKQN